MSDPKPIPWNQVAIVGFLNGNAVLISSVEPRVIFDTLTGLIRKEHEEGIDFIEWEESISATEVAERIGDFRWELYSVEDAKAVFSARCLISEKEPEDKPKPFKPLPGQKELFS